MKPLVRCWWCKDVRCTAYEPTNLTRSFPGARFHRRYRYDESVMILRLFIVRLAVVLGLASAQAVAQWQEPEGLRITREEFQRHAEALEFTVAQREAAEMMFEEYGREFDDAWNMHCKLSEWLWSNTSSSSWYGGESEQAFSDVVRDGGRTLETRWNKGGRALEAAYFDRLARTAIGREDTIEWLRRKHLRERVLHRDTHSTDAPVDVIALTLKFDPNLCENPAVKSVLDEYELTLDQALRGQQERQITRRWRRDRTADAFRKARDAGHDATALLNARIDVLIEFRQDASALWRLNASTLQRIRGALPPDVRPAFDDAAFFSLHAYLRPEHVVTPDELLARALQRDNLSEAQREHFSHLRACWRAQRDAALPELHRTYMATVDPTLLRETWTLILTDQRVYGTQKADAVDDAWEQAQQAWLAQCKKVAAEIGQELPGVEAHLRQDEISPEFLIWWEQMLAPTMSREGFSTCAEALDFDDEHQAALFSALYGDMAAEHAALAVEARTRLEKVHRAQQAWSADHPGEDAWTGYGLDFGNANLHFYILEERERIDQRFEADVSMFLDEAQRATWIDQTRALRRRTVLPAIKSGWHQHDTYDLVTLLDEVVVPANRPESASEVLSAYIEQMDGVLRRWQVEGRRASQAMMANGMGAVERAAGGNPDKARRHNEAAQVVQAIVADMGKINAQFTLRLCEALPPALAVQLTDAVDRFGYAQVFMKCPAELALELVRLTPDIPAETRDAVEAMMIDYVPQRDAIRRQIVDVVSKWKKGEYSLNRELRENWERQQRGEATGDEWREKQTQLLRQHPANPLLQRRHDLAMDAVRQMRSVFSDDEIARLPLAARLCLTAWQVEFR